MNFQLQLIFKEISFNQKFEDQYSDDIKKISQSRNAPESSKEDLEQLLTPTLQSDTGIDGANSFDYVAEGNVCECGSKEFYEGDCVECGAMKGGGKSNRSTDVMSDTLNSIFSPGEL